MKCYIDLIGKELTVTIDDEEFVVNDKKYKELFEKKKPYFAYIKVRLNVLNKLKVKGTYIEEDDFFYVTSCEDSEGNELSLDTLPSIKHRIISRECLFTSEYNPLTAMSLEGSIRENCPVKYHINSLFKIQSNLKNDGLVVVDGKDEYKLLDVPLSKVLTTNTLESLYEEHSPSSSTEFYNKVKDKFKGYKLTEIKKITNKFYKNINNSKETDKRKK